MANGTVLPNPEQPRRVEVLKAGAEAAGCAFEAPADRGMGPIAAVHSAEYLTFLRTIHARWRRIPGAGAEVIPNIHPDRRERLLPALGRGPGGLSPGRHRLPHLGRHLGGRLLVGADRTFGGGCGAGG
jgi:hypothetical protein